MIRFLLLAVILAYAPAGDAPYPKGKSHQKFGELSFYLVLPEDYDPAKEYSLLVALHGMDATETSIASWFEPLAREQFVVCAPRASGSTWNKPDIEKVKELVGHLTKVLSIGEGRLHGTGFSNGGQKLPLLVFDKDLRFASACFMGSGFTGYPVPKRAKKEMGVLAIAGSKDRARGAAEKTPDLLKGKVRQVECRIQEGLDHDIPDELMPYCHYWLKVMEGRFFPGETASFEWVDDLEVAKLTIADEKKASFVYFYDERLPEDAAARRVEFEVFFDPLVRHFGSRLVAVKLDVEIDDAYLAELGFEKTPAIAVLKPDMSVAKTFEGDIDAKALAKAMRSVAKDRSMPKR
jgi:predicted esterase